MMAADIVTLPKVLRTEIKRFFDENEAWLVKVLRAGQKARTLKLAGTAEVEARLLSMGLEGAMLVSRSYGEIRRFEEIAARLLAGVGIAS
jgi:TetR/AcrR family transcriptional repressor of nem operon